MKKNAREQLLYAGLKVFHRQGFNASGVQEITTDAGVPKGSFYNHFESKEAFGASVVDLYWELSMPTLEVLRDGSVPPLQRLRKYFDCLCAMAVKHSDSPGCLIGNLSAELSGQSAVVRERLLAAWSRWSSVIEESILEAQRANDIKGDIDARDTADFILHAWEGALLRFRVEQNRKPLDGFIRLIFDRVLV